MKNFTKINENRDRIVNCIKRVQIGITEAQNYYNGKTAIKKSKSTEKCYDEIIDHTAIYFEELADHMDKETALLLKEIDRLKEEALNG